MHLYLSRELRGQLLGRDVELVIHDRVARGLSRKQWHVVAQPYLGRPLREIAVLPVPGHTDASVELYYVSPDEDRDGLVELTCGGATVLDDLAAVDGDAEGHADEKEQGRGGGGAAGAGRRYPWSSGRFEGVIDFPELQVAPSTRRGVVANAAFEAFLEALPSLEAQLRALLAEENARREQQRQERVAVELRRAFRSVARSLPEYDMFDVGARARNKPPDPDADPDPDTVDAPLREAAPGAPVDPVAEDTTGPPAESDDESPALFPPGPLAEVRIRPARPRAGPGGTRALAATVRDADGRTLPPDAGVTFFWELEGPGALQQDGRRARYEAPDHLGAAQVTVRATQGENACEATVRIEITDAGAGPDKSIGIPEPRAVNAPGERWRARMTADTWEYNEGHRDYRAVADVAAQRVRYLSHLFAKELVLRNFGRPADAVVLERMVEVITYLHARGG